MIFQKGHAGKRQLLAVPKLMCNSRTDYWIILLHYITCHLADAFIQSDLQLAFIRGHFWGVFSILPKDTTAWAGIRAANLLVVGQLLYPSATVFEQFCIIRFNVWCLCGKIKSICDRYKTLKK